MPDYAIRVTLPFEDCSGSILAWFGRASSGVVYEHEADADIKQTHIHIVLFGSQVEDEQLKRMFRLLCKTPGKGNGFWSFKETYLDEDKVERPIDEGAITYASKGNLQPKYSKLFSQEQLETLRMKWVDRVSEHPSGDTPTQKYIKDLTKKYDYVQCYDDLPQERMGIDRNGFNTTISRSQALYIQIRSDGMKMFLGRNKFQAPPKSLFGTVTNSVFFILMDRVQDLDSAINIVLEKY